MEPLRRAPSPRRLVAVFESEATARAAAGALRDAGIATDNDTASDEVASLRGEMSEEMQHTIVGPGNFGPFTKEMTRGIVKGTILWTFVGAIVGLPFGLIDFLTLSLGFRLGIAAAVGALMGAGVGFYAGGAFRWNRDVGGDAVTKQLAAERGVTLGVWADSDPEVERAAQVLEDFNPIRLDRVTPEGHALRTVTTEEDNPE